MRMRSLLSFALLALARIVFSDDMSCVEIEKRFREEFNSDNQPVCICTDSGVFNRIEGVVIECESASIASVSENLAALNGTLVGRLTIRDSTVNVLPQDVFDDVRTKQLKLERCGLSSIHPDSFGSLGDTLEQLSLRENRLKHLEKGLFSGLPSLKKIDLGMNKIQDVEPGTFDEMKNLEEILLTGNEIQKLRTGTFEGLSKLRKLSLENCGLEVIEKDAFHGIENIEELILSNNKIAYLDFGVFSGLKNLRVLDLGSNKLTKAELKSFPKLEKIVLNNNNIDSMKQIKLKDLPSLVVAMIDRNKIQMLGDMDMFGLTRSDRIRTLSFAWNNLTTVAPKAFQHTPNLNTLLLQNNMLKQLSSNTSAKVRTPFLAPLKKLMTLQLSANNLTIIRSDELPKSLVNLALDHNAISNIEARALEGMAIKRLYLHYNKLSYLYKGTFDSFAPNSIEAIDVSSNSWQCLCKDPKEWLPRWISEAEESDVSEGPVGCLAIPFCGIEKDPKAPPEEEQVVRAGWITVAATILTIVTILIMVIIAVLYFRDNIPQFPLRGRRSDSDLHKLIENDPLNIASDSILVVPPMPRRKPTDGPKKTVRFDANF